MAVRFLICPLFTETYAKHNTPRIREAFANFLKVKSQNPLQPYGNGDRPSPVFKHEIPGILHSHLTHDISIWFTISGRDPHIIKLFGIFTHDESGTGNNPGTKVAQKLAKKMARQDFSPLQNG